MTLGKNRAIARAGTAALVLAIAGLAVSCQEEAAQTAVADPDARIASVTSALGEASDLSISSRMIASAQLGDALDGEGSYTIFVPVDEAWSALDSEELQALESDDGRPQLVAVLRQHIAPGTVLQADMADAFARSGDLLTLATMGAAPLTLHRADQVIHIGEDPSGPKVVGAPIIAGNDVIYRIDQLIPPPE